MLDLEKFIKSEKVIVPILNGRFQFNRKKYYVDESVYGWYIVSIQSNSAEVVDIVLPELIPQMDVKNRILKGYTYNNSIIPFNFDSALRKFSIDVMSPLHFNNSPTYSSIEAIVWEDNCIYYYRPNYTDFKISELQQTNDISTVKGLTPELKTVFLFHTIEKLKLQKLQYEQEQKRQAEEFLQTIPGRLHIAFSSVGGRVLNYSLTGKKIIVDWELTVSGRKFNSVIEKDTFRVIEAGFCMSGSDKDHNVTSLVLIAEDYENDRKIHITRETDD